MKQTKIPCSSGNIVLTTADDGVTTSIESDLLNLIESDDPDMEIAIHAIESLILAQYTAGIKVGSPAYGEALDIALESISNNL